jgi:phage-related protein
MAFDGTGGSCWKPDVPIQVDREWRLRIAQFGDGYQQRTLDGINALDSKFQVSFEQRPKDIILAMDAYLQAEKASSFNFLEPVSNVTYRVFCDSWHITWAPKRRQAGVTTYYGSLSAEFVKANGVTA